MAYRDEVALLAHMPQLARSYNRLDTERLHETATEKELRDEIRRAGKEARKRTSDRALPKFTDESGEGERRILEDPPLIRSVTGDEYEQLAEGLDAYLDTLAPHWRRVVAGYTLGCLLDGHLAGWRLGLFAFILGVLIAGMKNPRTDS